MLDLNGTPTPLFAKIGGQCYSSWEFLLSDRLSHTSALRVVIFWHGYMLSDILRMSERQNEYRIQIHISGPICFVLNDVEKLPHREFGQ